MINLKSNIKDVITGSYLKERFAKYILCWEDVKFLGKNNLEVLINVKQKEINKSKKSLEELSNYALLLKDKTPKYFLEEAKNFDNPKIPRKNLVVSNNLFSYGRLVPSRKKDLGRDSNSTTFNNCGWCKYGFEGEFIGSCMIDGRCDIFSINSSPENRGFSSEGCLITELSKEKINCLYNMYEQKIEEINLRLKHMQNSLEDMKFVSLEAEQKPILPVLRPSKYFNIGDTVLFFVEKGKPDFVIKGGIFEGEVICDYKHHKGWVNFVTNKPFHTGDFKEGKGWRNVIKRADILLKTDVEYLKNNKEYSKLWFGTVLEKYYNPKFKEII